MSTAFIFGKWYRAISVSLSRLLGGKTFKWLKCVLRHSSSSECEDNPNYFKCNICGRRFYYPGTW